MREIKFRVFNKKTKVMIMNVQDLHDGLGVYYDEKNDPIKNLYEQLPVASFGEVLIAVENGGAHYDGDWELDLMEYTGIKDKNGVEIHEGDIVRLIWKHTTSESIITKEVKDIFHADRWLNSNKDDYEVIGNIHQNPELLEKHETQ